MNNCLVEFADGYKVITSRNFVRKFPAPTLADDKARMESMQAGTAVV